MFDGCTFSWTLVKIRDQLQILTGEYADKDQALFAKIAFQLNESYHEQTVVISAQHSFTDKRFDS